MHGGAGARADRDERFVPAARREDHRDRPVEEEERRKMDYAGKGEKGGERERSLSITRSDGRGSPEMVEGEREKVELAAAAGGMKAAGIQIKGTATAGGENVEGKEQI
jgi:hypothetical protein